MDPREQKYGSESRRDFLKMTAVIPLALSLGGFRNGEVAADTSQNSARQSAAAPWYRRTYRWLSAQRAAAGSCGERHERGVLGTYFRFIEDFGAPHMMLLAFFGNDERRKRSSHCHTIAQYMAEGLGIARRQRYYWLFPLAITDLHARGLITIQRMDKGSPAMTQ